MDSLHLVRDLFRRAHEMLEATMSDVTPEQLHWLPPGKAHPIGALYAHVVMGEDVRLNQIARKGQPLFTAVWNGKIGLSELPPLTPPWDEWARRVQVDLPVLREYARAVYVSTDEFLASLSEDVMDQAWEQGKALPSVLAGHVYLHCGEISCLKGLQGEKGYPF